MSMNHSDLVAAVAGKLEISGADAKRAVEAVFETVAGAMAAGEEVSISAFGKFKVKETAARTGRNPATGAEIQIAASRKPAFSAAKGLKDRVG